MKRLRYKSYKDSGIEWIGEIPQSWNIDRIKASIKSCKNGIWGDEPVGDANDTICVRVADFNRDNLSVDIKNPTLRSIQDKDKVSRTLIRGDLLLEKSGGGENQPVGTVVLYSHDVPAVCSNFIARMSLKDGMCPAFWKYLHAAAYSIRLTVGSINQTSGIQNLDQDRYFNEKVPYPSLGEQQSIADFLDLETGKIDELIQNQQKLIELLGGKKESVLSEALIRGIDKEAKLINSGSEILGLVPSHWPVRRLKYFLSLNPSHKENSDVDSAISAPFFAMESIGEDGTLSIGTEKPYAEASNSYTYFKNGDVIVAKVTPCFENGKGALVKGLEPGFGFGTTELVVLRPGPSIDGEYLYYLSTSQEVRKSGVAYMTGAGGLKRVPDDFYLNLKWPIPPLNEQLEIVNFLKIKLEKMDLLINKAKHSIDLLKEHRTSLISAAVTGKIDVRELA